MKLKQIHLWLGLTLGILFSVLSLSGLVLVYQDSILASWYPALEINTQPSQAKTAKVLSHLTEQAKHNTGPYQLSRIEVPQTPNAHYVAKWRNGVDDKLDYINPDSLETELTRTSEKDWILWAFQLHTHLLGGDIGEQVLGVLTLGILVMIIAGLWIWWPGRHKLKRNITPPRNRQSLPWLFWFHRVNGALFSPLLFIAVLTGLGMVYFTQVKGVLVTVTGGQTQAPTHYAMHCPLNATKISWQQQIERVHSTFPDAKIVRVYPSHSVSKPNRFRLKFAEEWHQNGRTYVYINPCNNQVVYAHDARKDNIGAQWANMIYPIHSVHVGGLLYQGLMTLCALTPPLLFGTGLLTWYKRRRRYGKKPRKKH